MKFCKFCGAECKEDATFCPECGKQIGEPTNSVNVYVQPDTTPNNQKSSRSKIAAGLLQIFLGCFGIGRFYTGHTGIAIAQLIVSLCSCGIGSIWGFIDGIVILCTNNFRDAEGKIME